MKSNHNTTKQKTQSNSSRAVLARLDSYMDATGHSADHPWRTEIAAALAQPVEAEASLEHALAAVNVADLGVSIIKQLATLIDSIAVIADIENINQDALHKQVISIRRLAKHAHHFAADYSESFECDRDDLLDALAALKGGAQ